MSHPAQKAASTRTTSGSATPPIDAAHLSRYTAGDSALERELLRLFANQSQIYLAQLKEARSDQAWREAAHCLKGAAAAIGASRVAASAKSAEEANSLSRRVQLTEIESALREARDYILAMLAATGGETP
jgi:HPt (histidine-containing phosphotransfer) domain-containing protein